MQNAGYSKSLKASIFNGAPEAIYVIASQSPSCAAPFRRLGPAPTRESAGFTRLAALHVRVRIATIIN